MRPIWPLLLTLPILACEDAPSEKQQARQFLEAVTDLETDDGLDAHHTRLQALQKMSLSYPRLRETRDRCVQAHTGLMLAEAAQANARAELLIAQRRDAGGGGLPPDVTQRVASAIRKANDQLEVARVAFDHCRRETRALAVEFR